MQRVCKGDLVQVIAGKHKGKRARVLRVIHQEDSNKSRVVLERLQLVKRHTKPTQKSQGGILEKEGTVHLSNVMPIDTGSDRPTRVRVSSREGVSVRLGKSGVVIEAERKA
jgi:large subunit ribosomal protein L24